ncbi:putative GNAT family acetyltransferase [Okibacterium sp. HSC-33S16]|uniref:GNAT family N-acetyltransferase n=1 Tax=Okibacterium sp. HSC-33S16 TaxID=2910965 RepID=UPI0020A20C4E|nr:GNAT family N-acetyltransferase [Okibacterium sp. HSC-33S16]MCP2032575.1 putative GNAT family acetyltransferase [Okibacterium sp. HSC-33S16]
MTHHDGFHTFEYPDTAGYPDGAGFLDEGTARLIAEVTADAAREVDRPSAETNSEITLRRYDDESVYVAMMDSQEIATLRFAVEDDRIDVLATTVDPAFRGRGLAADLIADALDDIRSQGRHIRVYCGVVAAFITRYPQYADLVDPAR